MASAAYGTHLSPHLVPRMLSSSATLTRDYHSLTRTERSLPATLPRACTTLGSLPPHSESPAPLLCPGLGPTCHPSLTVLCPTLGLPPIWEGGRTRLPLSWALGSRSWEKVKGSPTCGDSRDSIILTGQPAAPLGGPGIEVAVPGSTATLPMHPSIHSSIHRCHGHTRPAHPIIHPCWCLTCLCYAGWGSGVRVANV